MPTVIAGIDCGDHSPAVLRWAVRRAGIVGADVVAVTTWGSGLPPAARGLELDTASSAARALHAVVAAAVDPGGPVRVTEVVSPERADEELLARSAAADLVVIGRRTHLPHPLGRVGARVTARAQCPVAVVGEGGDDRDFRRIVVGLDGSPSSRAALAWAIDQAALTASALDAVHTWQWRPDFAVYPYGRSDDELQAVAVASLNVELAGRALRGVEVSRRVIKAHPADALILLSREADLLVVGDHGGRPSARHLLGSVSMRVAARAHCPVVVMHDHAVRSVPVDAEKRTALPATAVAHGG